MKESIYRRTDKIYLHTVSAYDSLLLLYWRSIKENAQWFFNQISSLEAHFDWFYQYLKQEDDYIFLAGDEISGIPIGMVSIYHINNGTAEFGRLLLAHPDYRGKGLSKEITQLALGIAFQDLCIEKIYLTVQSNNERAINLYQSLGFRVTKSETQNIEMEITKEEYYGKYSGLSLLNSTSKH